MLNDKEVFEFQERVIKKFRRAEKELYEEFEVSKALSKNLSIISQYLEIYEIAYDTLIKVSEVLNKIGNQKELSTIEKEIKKLLDDFWK